MKTFHAFWRTLEQFSLWLVVTGLCWLVLAVITIGLLRLLPLPPIAHVALLGLGLGALLGLAQWHFLLPDDVPAGGWVALSAAAGWLALLVGTLLLQRGSAAIWLLLAAGSGGLLVGAAQAYLLRLQALPAWRWWLLTVVGWLAAGGLGAWLLPMLPLTPDALAERLLVSLGAGAVLLSYVAAIVLVTLFPRADARDRSVRTANWY